MICKKLIIFFVFQLPFFMSTIGFAQKFTLDIAIEEALANNPDIVRAGHEIQSAKAIFWKAVSPRNPHIFAEFEGIPDNQSLSEYGSRKIGFAQDIEFPLAYYYRGKKQQFTTTEKAADFEVLRNDVIAKVKKSFYKVLMLQMQKQLYEDIHELITELYQKTRIRVDAGESTAYDLLKTKVDLVEAENRVQEFSEKYKVALYELKLILGRKKSQSIDIEGDFSFLPVILNVDSLKQVAMAKHPLLIGALLQVDQKRIEEKLAWIELLPNFEVRYFNHSLPDNPTPNAWGGSIDVSLPVWSFFKDQGNIRSASHQVKAYGWQIESKKRTVLLEIEESYSQLSLAKRVVQRYRDNSLREVEELVRIATRSYEEGEMSYLEVTEALRRLNSTKAGYYQALYNYQVALAELEKAVGTSLYE